MEAKKEEQDLSTLQILGLLHHKKIVAMLANISNWWEILFYSSLVQQWRYQFSWEVFLLVWPPGGLASLERYPHLPGRHCGWGAGSAQVQWCSLEIYSNLNPCEGSMKSQTRPGWWFLLIRTFGRISTGLMIIFHERWEKKLSQELISLFFSTVGSGSQYCLRGGQCPHSWGHPSNLQTEATTQQIGCERQNIRCKIV